MMKKVLILLVMAAMMLSLCACKSEEVKNVEAMIDELPETEAMELDQVIEVQEAYSALSEKDREKVGNYSILEDAYEACYCALCDRMNEVGEACDRASANIGTVWSNVGPDDLMATIQVIVMFSFEDTTWEEYKESMDAAAPYLWVAANGLLGDNITADEIADGSRVDEVLADCVEFKKELNTVNDNYEQLFDDVSAFRSAFKDDYPEEIGTLNDWNTTLNQFAKLCMSPEGSYITYTETVSDYHNGITQYSTVADSYY